LKDAAELIAGLMAQDPKAQGFFWQTFWGRTYLICVRILGKGPDATDTAVDLLTDFAGRRIHDLKEPTAIFAYLRLSAIRRSLEVKRKRDTHSSLDFDIEDFTDRTPETHAEATKLMPRLDRCLGLLTEKAGQCLRLKYTRDLTNEDIGRLLGGSKQYIGRLIQKSLEALRKCIEKGFGNEVHPLEETMTRDIEPPVTIKTVEHLLSLRPRPAETSHEAELFSLARVIAGSNDELDARRADEHLSSCAECRELSMLLHQLDAEEEFGDDTRRGKSPFYREGFLGRSSLTYAIFSAAAVLVLGLSIVFSVSRVPSEEEKGGRLSVKGYEDDFIVAARRGASTFTINPMDRLQEGDALGMFYSSDRSGYLLVLSIDASKNAVVLYPAEKLTSAPILEGERISVADGALVEQGQGCEWLAAVFSDEPVNADAAIRAVKTGRMTHAQCRLDLEVDGARTIRILPVTR
jgi:RNA polymerase sigma factor (sigma-70 family)